MGPRKLVWHPACLIKEGGCVDLGMDTLHLKYVLVLFGSEGSALTLPFFLLSPRIILHRHCSSTMTEKHFLLISYATKAFVSPTVGRPCRYINVYCCGGLSWSFGN